MVDFSLSSWTTASTTTKADTRRKAKRSKLPKLPEALLPMPADNHKQESTRPSEYHHVVPKRPDNAKTSSLHPQLNSRSIECWPAGISTRHSLFSSSPSEEVEAKKAQAAAKLKQLQAQHKAQPAFYRELQSYLQSQLKSLGCEDTVVSAARIQVFSECFQYFIDEFHTYQPFLAQIKHEYESLLDHYTIQLQELGPLRTRLTTLEAEAQQQLQLVNLRHEKTCTQLQKSLVHTQAQLARYAASNAKLEEQNREYQVTAADHIQKYQTMLETNQTLVTTIKRQEEESIRRDRKDQDNHHMNMVTKNMLDKATAEVKRLKKENEMFRDATPVGTASSGSENQSTIIPQLQKQIQELTASLQTTKQANTRLVATVEELTARHAADEKKSLQKLSPRATRSASFNLGPNEEKDVEGENWFKVLTQHKIELEEECLTMDQAFEVLCRRVSTSPVHSRRKSTLHELTTTAPLEEIDELVEKNELTKSYEPPGTYFTGYGTAPTIPKYLQYDGKLRNVFISKRDTERVISECWKQKEVSDKTGTPSTLEEFFHHYLLNLHSSSEAVCFEWAYNLMNAFEQYNYDSDCRLFQAILQNEVAEEVRVDQLRMLYRVYETMVGVDKADNNGQTTGKIPLADFMRHVRQLFPLKTEIELAELNKALLFESKGSSVDYVALLAEDRDGNQGKFCECLREQHLNAILEFTQLIETKLHERWQMHGNPDTKDLSIRHLRKVLQEVDPNKSMDEINEYLARGTSLPMDEILNAEAQTIDLPLFLVNLKKGLVKPSDKPEPAPEE